MSTASANPGLSPAGHDGDDRRPPQVIPVPPELRLAAASRLISDQSGDPLQAAQRFLQSAEQLRIDLSLMWCTFEGAGQDSRVGQVCLAVMGSGRTAMLFISGPAKEPKAWARGTRSRPTAQHLQDRAALIQCASRTVAENPPPGKPSAVLAQALLEPRENDAIQAFRAAGFLRLGDLAYLRRKMPKEGPGRLLEQAANQAWPEGLTVRSIADLSTEGHSPDQIDAWLLTALERSYVQTLDCPELCGLRSMHDVLESHRSVGVYDPALWWLVRGPTDPEGCVLLSVCPEQDSVELVYLGLAPTARERGLGGRLLAFALRRLYDSALGSNAVPGRPHVTGTGGVTCAVDTRNAPALRLYKRAGFERFGLRVPLVRSLRSPSV